MFLCIRWSLKILQKQYENGYYENRFYENGYFAICVKVLGTCSRHV